MRSSMSRAAAYGVAVLAVTATLTVRADAPAKIAPRPTPAATPGVVTLPLDQIRPGMVGVGRTVFEGTKIEDFKVTVIGVLENVGPKQSMILARLEGGPLEKTGVIAGMSGSPVYIDGKLIGAVAYGFPFSKETIAGITPIGGDDRRHQRRAGRAPPPRASPLPSAPPDPRRRSTAHAMVAALHAADAHDPAGVAARCAVTCRQLVGPIAQLPLPAPGLLWLRPRHLRVGARHLLRHGLHAHDGHGRQGRDPGGAASARPAARRRGGRLAHRGRHGPHRHGHGHPHRQRPRVRLRPSLLQPRPHAVPDAKAYVYSVFPSLYQSWKISSAARRRWAPSSRTAPPPWPADRASRRG